jgi:hypothetical protein
VPILLAFIAMMIRRKQENLYFFLSATAGHGCNLSPKKWWLTWIFAKIERKENISSEFKSGFDEYCP